jgi:hypothetical protein
VDRARRQYDLVDPANRLVAEELESRWNTALSRAAELERQLAELDQVQEAVTPQERERLLGLGRDLPSLWDHPAATAELKKRLLRAARREIVIADNADRTEHVLALHWQGGVHTELGVKRTRTGQHRRTADADVITLVSEPSKVCTDRTIAATLNRLGYRTGTGKTWRAHSVVNGVGIAADTVGEFGSGRLAPRIRLPGVPLLPHLPAKRPSMGIRRSARMPSSLGPATLPS